jgi:peptidoglycan/LPS O-acetylase OafA/YrhL
MPLHFRILGFWRVAAALLVMVFHYLIYGPPSGLEAAHRMRVLMPLLDMFLLISGFLIMYRYADRLLVERGGYQRFIVRRLARFYPLYLVTLIYFVLVGIAVHMGWIGSTAHGRYDWSALPANILLVQGWGFTDRLTFNYVGWTLSAEWFCYLTLPVVILAYRRFGIGGLVGLILASCVVLEIMVATGVMPFETWMAADTWGAYRAFADFSIGALVAVLVRDSRWRLASPLPGWALFLVTCLLMWNGLGGYPALALLALSTYLAALAERNDQDATRLLKPFDAVANASFSIYLIHPVVASLMLGIVWRRILEPLDVVSYYAFWLAPMALTVLLALLSARWFEAPLAKLLNDRFAATSGRHGTVPSRAAAARLPQQAAKPQKNAA